MNGQEDPLSADSKYIPAAALPRFSSLQGHHYFSGAVR